MPTDRTITHALRLPAPEYAYAVGWVGFAFVTRHCLDPLIGEAYPFALFYLATAAVAVRGRLGPSLVAMGSGFLLGWFAFLAPRWSFSVAGGSADAIGLILNLAVFGAIVVLGVRLGRRQGELEALNACMEERVLLRTAELEGAWGRLRGILDGSRDLIAALDAQGRFVAFNQAFEQAFRQTFWKQITLGMPLREALAHAPGDQEAVMELWSRALAGEEFSEVRELGEGATRRPYEFRFSAIRDGRGRLVGAAHFVRDVSERMAEEERIRHANAELAARADDRERALGAVFEHAGVGMAVASLSGRLLKVNRQLCEITGFSAGELQHKTLEELTLPEDAEMDRAGLRQLVAGEHGSYAREKRHRRRNGTTVWTHLTLSLVRNRAGESDYVIVIIQDISARKEAQRALRETEARLHRLWDADIIGVMYADGDGRITEANDALLEMLGFSRQDLAAGRVRWSAMTPPEFAEIDRRGMAEARARGACAPYEKVYIGKDGRRVPILLGYALLEGSESEYICFVLDLSARKQAEEALRESEGRARLAMAAAGLGFWDYQVATGMVRWSPEHNRLVGLAPELTEGPRELFIERVHPEDRAAVVQAVAESLRKKQDCQIEYRVLWPDGTVRWMAGDARPLYSDDGAPTRMIGVVRDVTERRDFEERLRRKREQLQEALARAERAREEAEEANAAKDRFLAALSHELRTPLNPALLATSEMVNDAALPEHLREELRIVRSQIELEARLIDDLLDVTAISRGKLSLNLQPIDAREVLARALHTVKADAEAKQVELALEPAGRELHVQADPARLQQVFWNLLRNAVKFTPPGGKVTLRSVVHGSNGGAVVRFEVTDTGVGIAPEHVGKVFEAFYQGDSATHRTYGGLGLGLAICRSLVEMHAGHISVASEGRGRGATFAVEMPVMAGKAPAAPASPGEEAAAVETSSGPLRILLVEDHAESAALIARLLRRSGHEVAVQHTVAGGKAAAEGAEFDLLVSDLGLPDGSGLELMQCLKAELGLRGIALSGFGTEADIQRSREAGFDEHLTKPVDVGRLRAAVERLGRGSVRA